MFIYTVYRVLTEQEIQQWDRLTEEYISDQLTSLGLKRQREKLLLNAGLLYNFTKDIMHEASPTPALGIHAESVMKLSCTNNITCTVKQC